MKTRMWRNTFYGHYSFNTPSFAQFIHVYRDGNGFAFGRAIAKHERLFQNNTFERSRYLAWCSSEIYTSDMKIKNRTLEYRSFNEMSYII